MKKRVHTYIKVCVHTLRSRTQTPSSTRKRYEPLIFLDSAAPSALSACLIVRAVYVSRQLTLTMQQNTFIQPKIKRHAPSPSARTAARS